MYGYSPDIYSFSQDITQILAIVEGEWKTDKPHRILLKSVNFHDVNFVPIGGTGGCHYGNLLHHHGWLRLASWLYITYRNHFADHGTKGYQTHGSIAVPTYHAALSDNAHARCNHIDPTASTASLASVTFARHDGTPDIEQGSTHSTGRYRYNMVKFGITWRGIT